MRLHDLTLGALNEALPGSVPSSGISQVAVTYISTSELGAVGRVVVANPVVGGSGGGPQLDGVSGTDYPCAFLRNVPVEILESEIPVLVHGFSLVPDSEGSGKFRGGSGIRYDLEIRHPSAVVVMRGKDRYRFQAWGIHGGRAGRSGACFAVRPTDHGGLERIDIGKVTVYRPRLGEVISIQGGGGGGYGDPLERDPHLVLADVVDGLVSESRAREQYGVIIRDGVLCSAETSDQRNRMRGSHPRGDGFDPGPGRREWEARFGVATNLITLWLQQIPIELRHYAKEQAFRSIERLGPGPYLEAEVERALTMCAEQLQLQRETGLVRVSGLSVGDRAEEGTSELPI
jgi:N-methylhydantoinase B